MGDKKDDGYEVRKENPDELYVVELDERLEFGAAVLDSDLEADNNTGCLNKQECKTTNDSGCHNDSSSCTASNTSACD